MFGVGFLPYPSVFDKTFSTQFLNGGKQEKMKKRLLSMLMAVLMIASLVPAAALADGACAHPDKSITEISIKNDAVKKQPGLDIKVCNDCGKVLTAVVTPFADKKDICLDGRHTFKNEVLQAATCEKPSITVSYCAVCGTGATEPVAVSDITKVGHVYTQFTVVEKPTCQNYGWGYTVCDKCGEPEFVAGRAAVNMLPANATYAQKAAVEAKFAPTNIGHEDQDAFVTDTKDVYDSYVFAGKLVYNELVWKAAVEPTHSLTVGGTPASYVKDSKGNDPYAMHYLVRDNYNALVESDEIGHGLGYQAAKHCPDCDTFIDGKNLDGLNYTHANAMECTQVGYYPYMDKDGVKHAGMTDKWHCNVCDKDFGGVELAYDEYYQDFAFDANGLPTKGVVENDTWAGNDGKKATCEKDGNTATVYKYVKLANGSYDWQVLTPSAKIDKLGHDLVKVESKAATCKELGWTCDNFYVCDREGCDYTQGNFVTAGFAKCKYAATVIVAPTCKNSGLSVNACSVCGDVAVDGLVRVPAVPHTAAAELANVKAATCTEDGYTGDSVCKWCGKVLKAGEVVKAAGHTPEEVAAVAATCTKTGLTAGSKCSVCGEVLTAQEVVPALGHKFVNGVCTVCGEKDPNYVVPNPFKDVEKTSPYYDAIIWAANKGVTTGKTADTFGINDGCTRAQIVTFLYRAAGSPEVKADTVNPFTDVSKDSVYYNAILWAVEKGITKGTTETTFDPNAVCTRGQIVTFLFRASGDEKVATGTNFADVASGSYCADAVAWAVANKVANGFADGTFRPEATCTRGQAVTFIYRALAK